MINKKWPLHPRPGDNQLLSEWIKDLANLYEVSYQQLCKKTLKLSNEEIYNLRSTAPEKALTILSSATGIVIDELRGRDMNSRFKKWQEEIEEYNRLETNQKQHTKNNPIKVEKNL